MTESLIMVSIFGMYISKYPSESELLMKLNFDKMQRLRSELKSTGYGPEQELPEKKRFISSLF